jgi:uncharacterized protein YjiS (DUF1127 family)
MSQATTCPVAPPASCMPAGRGAAARAGRPDRRQITWFAAALDRLARPWRRGAAIRELQCLDDRALRDIGIERGEVDAVVDELMRGR